MPATAAPPAPVRSAERRIATRYKPAFGTVCRVGDGRPTVGLVWNLSETGLSMLLPEPLALGTQAAGELTMEDGTPGVAVRLRVVYARPVPTGDYMIGVEFARPLDAGQLTRFLTPPPKPESPIPVIYGWEPPRKG